jgi:hypothetical protein
MTDKLPAAATWYAAKLQWPIFPLKPRTKHPATRHGFKNATTDADQVAAWWTQTPDANIGMATGRALVLDFDTYKPDFGPEAAALLDYLEAEHRSWRADAHGTQLFYKQPEGLPKITNSTGDLPPAIDVRGAGGYTVLPPSRHPENFIYRWAQGRSPADCDLLPLPLFVADLILKRDNRQQRSTPKNGDTTIADFNRQHRIPDLLVAHGYTLAARHGAFTRLSRPGRDASQTSVVVTVLDGVERSYHHSTSDPLHCNGSFARDAFDVFTMLEYAGDAKAAFVAAKKRLGTWQEEPRSPAHVTAAAVEQTGNGDDVLTLSDQVTADLAAWGYSFAVDDLDDSIFVNGDRYSDFHAAELRTRARDAGYGKKGRPSLGALEDMIRVLANRNRYHPVRDWLNSLEWDGKNHFGTLCMHFHTPHEPIRYANGQKLSLFDAWLRRWALGAVAKAMGNSRACQQNAVLVLDGEQNRGKSYFARWLCSSPTLAGLFEESPITPGDKEHARRQCTKFIWEVSELGATMRSADREALKAFITFAERTFRRPYDRNPIVKPALASFVGTINNESGFLTDPTGNRRFLIATVDRIDWGYSTKVTPDQFWAQIMHWHREGQTWELTEEEAAAATTRTATTNLPTCTRTP